MLLFVPKNLSFSKILYFYKNLGTKSTDNRKIMKLPQSWRFEMYLIFKLTKFHKSGYFFTEIIYAMGIRMAKNKVGRREGHFWWISRRHYFPCMWIVWLARLFCSVSFFMKLKFHSTVWKLQKSSVTQILREINFGELRRCKTDTFVILEALEFVNLVFQP